MTTVIDMEAALDDMHMSVVSMLPTDLMDLEDIGAARRRLDVLLEALPEPPMPEAVVVSDVWVPGLDGARDVRVKLYTPDDLPNAVPAVYWIHGGGMVLLSADRDDLLCATRAAAHGCLVASVDYRLAPETPAPGPVNDCYAGLVWLADHADSLGIDPGRIMIGGASAGGGLAAGTALMARDRGGPGLIGQLLVYPMLDHRNETSSSHSITDLRFWNRRANILAWEAYLGGGEPTPYSSPSIATDLAELPPAFVCVGQFDMFLDEDVAYAIALNRAGVGCELHVYPGAFHASNGLVIDHPTSIRWRDDIEVFIARCLTGAL